MGKISLGVRSEVSCDMAAEGVRARQWWRNELYYLVRLVVHSRERKRDESEKERGREMVSDNANGEREDR